MRLHTLTPFVGLILLVLVTEAMEFGSRISPEPERKEHQVEKRKYSRKIDDSKLTRRQRIPDFMLDRNADNQTILKEIEKDDETSSQKFLSRLNPQLIQQLVPEDQSVDDIKAELSELLYGEEVDQATSNETIKHQAESLQNITHYGGDRGPEYDDYDNADYDTYDQYHDDDAEEDMDEEEMEMDVDADSTNSTAVDMDIGESRIRTHHVFGPRRHVQPRPSRQRYGPATVAIGQRPAGLLVNRRLAKPRRIPLRRRRKPSRKAKSPGENTRKSQPRELVSDKRISIEEQDIFGPPDRSRQFSSQFSGSSGQDCELYGDSLCLNVASYPTEEILSLLNTNKRVGQDLIADVVDQSADKLIDGVTSAMENQYTFAHYFGGNNRRQDGFERTRDFAEEGGFLCPSEIMYAKPKRGKTAQGVWKDIVNVKDYTQTLRMEKCLKPGGSCSYVSHHYKSQCSQVYNYHRLLSWTKERGLHMDIYKVPTCCSCHIKGYSYIYPPLNQGGPKNRPIPTTTNTFREEFPNEPGFPTGTNFPSGKDFGFELDESPAPPVNFNPPRRPPEFKERPNRPRPDLNRRPIGPRPAFAPDFDEPTGFPEQPDYADFGDESNFISGRPDPNDFVPSQVFHEVDSGFARPGDEHRVRDEVEYPDEEFPDFLQGLSNTFPQGDDFGISEAQPSSGHPRTIAAPPRPNNPIHRDRRPEGVVRAEFGRLIGKPDVPRRRVGRPFHLSHRRMDTGENEQDPARRIRRPAGVVPNAKRRRVKIHDSNPSQATSTPTPTTVAPTTQPSSGSTMNDIAREKGSSENVNYGYHPIIDFFDRYRWSAAS